MVEKRRNALLSSIEEALQSWLRSRWTCALHSVTFSHLPHTTDRKWACQRSFLSAKSSSMLIDHKMHMIKMMIEIIALNQIIRFRCKIGSNRVAVYIWMLLMVAKQIKKAQSLSIRIICSKMKYCPIKTQIMPQIMSIVWISSIIIATWRVVCPSSKTSSSMPPTRN